MDLCADMLVRHLGPANEERLVAERLCPTFRRRLTRLPFVGNWNSLRNADRLFNRFRTFPRFLRRRRHQFDHFHLCDHSYAHLLHDLPGQTVGVFCHDLDAFRSILEPSADPRPRWYRSMMRRVLDGFQKASLVFHPTQAIGTEIARSGLIDPVNLVLAHNGVSQEFTPKFSESVSLPFETHGHPFLLHVGSCIPRKRIDVLLDVFAETRKHWPELQLIQIGGDWTSTHLEQINRLGLGTSIQQLRGLTRTVLAECYRHAQLVLIPSSAEGFGLPVVEALACGAPVLASDIPVLREVGGAAVWFAPVGNVAAWSEQVVMAMRQPATLPDRAERLQWVSRFSWQSQAKIIGTAYLRLAAGKKPSENPNT
ncbi:MAG: glycosyltransferase family 4 protein [Planctomycetes bacterium]|nr:glycosyltransferase family 4 protein [Planctomycetota bacterium]